MEAAKAGAGFGAAGESSSLARDGLDGKRLVEFEARALLTRAARIKPFALTETMVLAATFPVEAQAAVERYLTVGRHAIRDEVGGFIRWLRGADGRAATPEEAHRRFVFIRLRFNVVLSQFDLFSEVMTQRSEHEVGVFLAGLDCAARDALDVPGMPYQLPPLVCYLQRGQGAAIRRARTRLPGGGENPIAIIKVPRERMVGTGIASSLVHEVGHQGAALLQLVESIRPALQRRAAADPARADLWRIWERWCSEMIADLWSVARVGIAAPVGLMGVVALPRAFVFRREMDEPHPIPWLRVLLSCAMGSALYPHRQWDRAVNTWVTFYPPTDLNASYRTLLMRLRQCIPDVVAALAGHRPESLGGRTVGEALATADRQPRTLAALYTTWEHEPLLARKAPPSLVFAALAQAKVDGRLSPERESRILAHLLTTWALRSSVDTSEICATYRTRRSAPAV
jgi:hypothetical protein